jgi:hypothetical protein
MERLKVALNLMKSIFQANFRHFEPLCVASAGASAMAAENIMDLIGHFTQWSETDNTDTFWLIY